MSKVAPRNLMFPYGLQVMADPVWLMVMFDLPVQSKEQRRGANQYRLMLLDMGFSQIQFSVYAKYLVNATGARRLITQLKLGIPSRGEVRALKITDEQWAGTYRWFGKSDVEMEIKPSQLALFE